MQASICNGQKKTSHERDEGAKDNIKRKSLSQKLISFNVTNYLYDWQIEHCILKLYQVISSVLT